FSFSLASFPSIPSLCTWPCSISSCRCPPTSRNLASRPRERTIEASVRACVHPCVRLRLGGPPHQNHLRRRWFIAFVTQPIRHDLDHLQSPLLPEHPLQIRSRMAVSPR